MHEFPSTLRLADIAEWTRVLSAGLTARASFALVVWGHSRGCSMHPEAPRRPTVRSRCRCRPDVDAVLNPGAEDQTLFPLIREGQPVAGDARGASAADRKPS